MGTTTRAQLGTIADFFADGDWIESKDQSLEGFRLVQTGNVGVGAYLDKKERAKFVSADTFERLQCTEIFAGDVLVSRLPDPVGRACILPDIKQRAITAVDCSIIRFNSLACEARYFIHFTRSQDYAHQISQFLAGSTRVRISRRNLQTVELPLPPLAEQRRIAAKLDAICEIVDKRGGQLAKLDQLVKSRFVEMFGDDTATERTRLGDSCGVGSGKRVFAEEFKDSGVPFFRGTEIAALAKSEYEKPLYYIAPEHYQELAKHTGVPKVGDLLLPSICMEGLVWRVDIDTPFYFKDGRVLWIKVPESVDSEYLRFALSLILQRDYHKIASGTTFAEMKIVNLKKLQVPLPPLGEQRRFAAFSREVDKSKFAVRKRLEKARLLYRAKLQEYFG